MASDIRVRVGNASATITLNATDQQVAAALTRFATSLGIPVTGTAQENLTAIIQHWIDDVKRRSKQVQAAELRAANEAGITATVEQDNTL